MSLPAPAFPGRGADGRAGRSGKGRRGAGLVRSSLVVSTVSVLGRFGDMAQKSEDSFGERVGWGVG